MQVTIEKLVYGGAGLARTEHGVVFVPRTAPGDVVEVEITGRKSDYSLARVLSIVEPSPDRREPDCPNYRSAGCCHWQHIRYARQLEIKESILRETLQRTGRLQWDGPIRIISGLDEHYRLRAVFHVRDHKAGFVQEHSHAVVPILECSALVPELNQFIPEVNSMLATPQMAAVREVRAVSASSVAAAFVSERGEEYRQLGTEPPRLTANGFTFEVHPDAFFQSNRYLLADFMQEVLDQAGSANHVLELFCGSGFFSIPLARRATEVLGVDSNPAAIRLGELARNLNQADNITFFEGDVETTLRASDVRPDLIVLNPPRAGCGQSLAAAIAALGAGRMVYVSCNPSTFAREAALFVAQGYRLQRLTLVDQFPNTYHIELVAMLERT